MLDSIIKKQATWHIVIVVLLLMAACGVSARVVYVHVVQSDFLKLEGERHYKRNIPRYAYRGNILDAAGRELAVSAPSFSIWADPSDLLESSDDLEMLSRLLKQDSYTLKSRAEKLRRQDFMYLQRQVEPVWAERIKAEGRGLVSVINERKRLYPEGSVFSHIVGVTDIDGNGVEGVELAFDHHLQGSDGVTSVIKDRIGRSFEVIDEPKIKQDGKDVVLSVDRNIQYIAYSELRAALARHEARSGMLIVLDAQKSKVLSIVNYPAYNPNDRRAAGMQNIRNRAVTDIFEPGSSI